MRILVVSHAATVASNQEPYAALLRRGADVQVVVPGRWRHELGGGLRPAELHPELRGRVHHARVLWPGSIQRHVHATPPSRWLRRFRPEVVLVDEEHFSVPAAQWVRAARRRGIPAAVNAWENLDRPLPWPARVLRHHTLRRAGVFARTPAAATRARAWGARGPIVLVPPAVPVPPELARPGGAPFTVGFAGRLVEAKGLRDLVAAVARLSGDVRLLVVGDGPLRDELRAHPTVELRVGVGHDEMAGCYAEMDVLVLPSRTTPTWAEQMGRVLLEAMAAGTPVIGSSSGEIPWVLEQARGGETFDEGDVDALVDHLTSVRAEPDRWRTLGEQGRRDVAVRFSPDASAAAFLELADALGAGQ